MKILFALAAFLTAASAFSAEQVHEISEGSQRLYGGPRRVRIDEKTGERTHEDIVQGTVSKWVQPGVVLVNPSKPKGAKPIQVSGLAPGTVKPGDSVRWWVRLEFGTNATSFGMRTVTNRVVIGPAK